MSGMTVSNRTSGWKAWPRALGCLLAAWVLMWAATLLAIEEYPATSIHRGVVSLELYQIFPENRPGNAVYYDNRLVFSLPNQTIITILPLRAEGRFAYLADDGTGITNIGVYVQHQDKLQRITDLGEGFHYGVMTLDGVVYKKIFRVVNGTRLLDLLPNSKTADGATLGPSGLVFYHVASVVEREGDLGEIYSEFGVRVHLALFEDERLRGLDFAIFNTLPKLVLEWNDPTEIVYTLADGRTEALSLSQFQ